MAWPLPLTLLVTARHHRSRAFVSPSLLHVVCLAAHPARDLMLIRHDARSTDAVLRYLLVEYGVAPQEVQNLQQAATIGDVLYVCLEASSPFASLMVSPGYSLCTPSARSSMSGRTSGISNPRRAAWRTVSGGGGNGIGPWFQRGLRLFSYLVVICTVPQRAIRSLR